MSKNNLVVSNAIASNVEVIDTVNALANLQIASVERFSALTLDAVRATFADNAKTVEAFAAAKSPKAALGVVVSAIEPALTRNIGFARAGYAISSEFATSASAILGTKFEAASKELTAAVDKFAANTPVGGDVVAKAVKQAVSAGNAAFDDASKKARKVVDLAEANINKAADATVDAVSKATKQVA